MGTQTDRNSLTMIEIGYLDYSLSGIEEVLDTGNVLEDEE